ncbi:hypothetical protein, partial [Serratia marcescens]|uniref:hypothetical protein n=1 Tax=Serratia marcescens TaxID=615 RepID=UPI0028149FFB
MIEALVGIKDDLFQSPPPKSTPIFEKATQSEGPSTKMKSADEILESAMQLFSQPPTLTLQQTPAFQGSPLLTELQSPGAVPASEIEFRNYVTSQLDFLRSTLLHAVKEIS